MRQVELDALAAIDAGDEIDWEPHRLVAPGSWAGHIPFAFWLVKTGTPRIVVELGTQSGNSYFAFCQAVASLGLPTETFAVVTRVGDAHARFPGEELFADVERHDRERYGAFSTLLRMPFDEAREEFSTGSIDILHIDGQHAYEAAKHDYETWRERLSDRAVVLFHDTNLRSREFGVWRLWKELAAAHPSFEFKHSNGLGVLGVGSNLPQPLQRLFAQAGTAEEATPIRRAFSRRGQIFQERAETLERERTIAEAVEARGRERLEHAEESYSLRRELNSIETGHKAHIDQILAADKARLHEVEGELQRARERIQELAGQLAQRQHEVALVHDAYRRSTSWRLTGPMRRAISMVKRRPSGESTAPVSPGDAVAQIGFAEPTAAWSGASDFKSVSRALLRERLEGFLRSGSRMRLPNAEEPDVTIVLVLYNQAELTFGCLASLNECLADSAVGAEIVILDNGSSDATGELLDRLEGVKVIRCRENLHFLRGVNRASEEARGRHILLLNNDAQLIPGSVEQAVRILDEDASIGAVGGRIILPDGTLQEAGSIIWADGSCLGYARGRPAHASEAMFRRDVAYCSGAFLMTPRKVFETLNRFDEAFAPAYYEETDYCVRLWEAGLRVVYDPAIAIVHYEFGSAANPQQALARQKHNHDLFGHTHRHWLQGQVPAGGNVHRARFARSHAKRILFIEDRVPKPELGAGYPRANDIIASLRRQGAQVTLFPMWRHPESWTDIRRCIADDVEVVLECDSSMLRAFLRERRGCYDAILVSRPHNMRVLRTILDKEPELQSGATLIYDAEALFSRRDILKAEVQGSPLSERDARNLVRDEMKLLENSDAVLSVSPMEVDLFRSEGIEDVVLLGHAVEIDPTASPFEARDDIIFLGATHQDGSPNADSILWFAREVLPLIRRELGLAIRLKVIGMVDAPSVKALEGIDLTLLGRLKDIRPAFESARMVVVPTRFAAGIPHKAHHAAALGVPIVATSLIAGQLGWKDGVDLLASDDAGEFARHCLKLYGDARLWQHLRQNALDRVEAECSQKAFDAAIANVLDRVQPIGDGRPPIDSRDRHLYIQRHRDFDHSVQIPFGFLPPDAQVEPADRTAAIVHLYYAEQAPEFRRYLEMLPPGSDVFISTDTQEKKARIERDFQGFSVGRVEVRVAPNRGRDIAPKLITFREVYSRYDFLLHLHSKASEHDSDLALWRTYLLESLVGSRRIVASHLWALRNGRDLGMIFPQHFDRVRRWIDWGVNLSSASDLAVRLNIELNGDRALDFPSGSMFWARSAVFRPLLDLDLSADEFPDEGGQKDATLAHAIERLYAIVAEMAGYRWMKVARPELMVDHAGILTVASAEEFAAFVEEKTVKITGVDPMPTSQELYTYEGETPPALSAAAARHGPQRP